MSRPIGKSDGNKKIHGKVLDWELVGEYFKLFESTSLFEELKRKYCEDK